MKKLKLSILSIFVLFFFVFIALGSGESTQPAKLTDSASGTQSATTSTAKEFVIGDKVKMGDIEITLNSVRFDNGNEYYKPETGIKWLVVNCTLENKGSKSESISSLLMFKLNDDEGYSRDTQLLAKTEGSLDGELAAGAKMRGELAYNVKDKSTNFKFIFEPNVFGIGQAVYNIPVTEVK